VPIDETRGVYAGRSVQSGDSMRKPGAQQLPRVLQMRLDGYLSVRPLHPPAGPVFAGRALLAGERLRNGVGIRWPVFGFAATKLLDELHVRPFRPHAVRDHVRPAAAA
jgi:hypothetical protein